MMQDFSPEDVVTAEWLDAPGDYLNLSLGPESGDEEETNPD